LIVFVEGFFYQIPNTKAAVQEARKKERMDDETPRYVLWYGED
jgi:hypothetical protein